MLPPLMDGIDTTKLAAECPDSPSRKLSFITINESDTQPDNYMTLAVGHLCPLIVMSPLARGKGGPSTAKHLCDSHKRSI